MEQRVDNKEQESFEAKIALAMLKEHGVKVQKETKNLKKTKIYATIAFFVATAVSYNVFINLNWPEDASAKVLAIGALGWIVILFSESMGKFEGNMWSFGRIGTNITCESPGSILRLLGWIFIFLPIVIALLNLASR